MLVNFFNLTGRQSIAFILVFTTRYFILHLPICFSVHVKLFLSYRIVLHVWACLCS